MKVVIAPDSFKDALSAEAAAKHIAIGLRSVLPSVVTDCCPVADGGEGFASIIAQGWPHAVQTRIVATVDPLGRAIKSSWVLLTGPDSRQTAVIELAAASGLERLRPQERQATHTSTFGTGLLIREALEHRPERLILGIGGSATNDAGCGIAQALGVLFFDRRQQPLTSPITGGDLHRITRMDLTQLHERMKRCHLCVACDVDNPLTGPRGAAHVYGPQKGATPEQVEQLDSGLQHVAERWREQLGVDVEQMPGAGAAGGVGGGLVAMLGAKLVPGAELVLDAINFDQRIMGADLIITGEGRLDSQSLQGKAAMAVARRAKAAGVPCVALVGSVGYGAEHAIDQGLTRSIVIGEGLSANESIRRTGELLERAAACLMREVVAE